jgi:hypothetical protein
VRETRAQREEREDREFRAAWALTKSHVPNASYERHSMSGVMPIRPGHELQAEISRVRKEIWEAEEEFTREDRARQHRRERDEW